jgi:hypothetical protein
MEMQLPTRQIPTMIMPTSLITAMRKVISTLLALHEGVKDHHTAYTFAMFLCQLSILTPDKSHGIYLIRQIYNLFLAGLGKSGNRAVFCPPPIDCAIARDRNRSIAGIGHKFDRSDRFLIKKEKESRKAKYRYKTANHYICHSKSIFF